MKVELLVENIGELVTLADNYPVPRRRGHLAELGAIRDGALAVAGGQFIAVGSRESVLAKVEVDEGTTVIDAAGRCALPGFVDAHTHLVFAGTREAEYALRVAGATYEQIMEAGGGIHYTTRLTREAKEQELFDLGRSRLDTMLLHGTTTVEAKSGYGLDTESELKLLRVARRLNQSHALEVVPTFLGAHLVPFEYRDDPDAYVALVIDDMLPRIAEEGLAEYCDVWCDSGIFTPAQSERILRAARAAGLRLRLHANQLGEGDGARLGVSLGADSVDHLERLPAEVIPLLAASDTTAVLLPGVAYTLREPYPDARGLIDSGVAVALATDLNPGSCYTESIPFILSLACTQMGMSPAEAIVASALNAAYSLRRADRVGSLVVGKQADFILIDAPNHAHLPYHAGVNLVHTVVKQGRVVVEEGRLVHESTVTFPP